MNKKSLQGKFHEVQYMAKDQPLLTLVVLFIAILSWATFVVQAVLGIPVGNNPAPDLAVWVITIIFGILFPLFMLSLCLETRVSGGVFRYRYFPFHLKWRIVGPGDIEKADVVEHSNLREFGGWGIRWNRQGKAYTVSGRQGVWITFRDGKKVFFGSKKAEELARALEYL